MRIHEVDSIELSRTGARGNRAFYVIDDRADGQRQVVRNLQVVVPDYDPHRRAGADVPDGARVDAGQDRRAGQTQFFGQRDDAGVIGPWAERSPRSSIAAAAGGNPDRVDRGSGDRVDRVRGSLRRLAEQANAHVDGRDSGC